jgi:dTDP-4-dehydrorhamnose 3,5-epimerase
LRRIETALPGVFIIEPQVFADSRGFFLETYHQEKFATLGIRDHFVQDNHSKSVRGTLRGLHYQLRHPQTKLCRVVQGEVFDVAVDVRHGSPTFGRWVAEKLSAENQKQIYIPGGFAHGFVVLSETAEFLYKCSDFYAAEDERGVVWNDPKLKITWNVDSPILSRKDQHLPRLDEIPGNELPQYEGVEAKPAAKSQR